LAEHRDRDAERTALGYGLAALSVDPPDRSRALAAQLALPIPLLCDPAREVVQAWGVYNREEKGGIAFPATFVLDRERVVRFRSLDRTASRADTSGLFAFLKRGVDSPAPEAPAVSAIKPTLGDWGRMLANAVRHGVRVPKP